MMTPREQTISEIRLRQSLGLRRPRRRLPRQVLPTLVGMEYWRAIVPELERARVLAENVARRWVQPGRVDGVSDDLDAASQTFFEQLRPRQVEMLAQKFADKTVAHADAQLKKQAAASLGVDVFTHERGLNKLLEPFVAENVALIRSIPNKYFDEVELLVTRAVAAGTRWEDLAKDLEERFGVAKNRAKLVARDQVGKLYGAVQQVRQEQLGVERYIWRTAHDNRVRDEHAAREGKIYSWAKPPADGPPGQAINCRCYAEPDFSDLLG